MTAPDVKETLLDAALIHVAFDGWSAETFAAAVADCGVDMAVARAVCPRGAVDLAMAYHQRGDRLMAARFAAEDMTGLRYSEKVAALVRFRIEAADDKEAVRRGTTLFTLPQYAADGARLIWNTCDLIWNLLGDSSDDVNWYTKRMTLSGVYSSTVLYWLGDDSQGEQATWEFLDRRIDDVMRFEKFKASVRANKPLSALLAGPMAVLGAIKAPKRRDDMPGHMGGTN
ncbi:COQ9 family protein [Thalassobius vesicularis]|uniref:COQ9 family protein n=1 Tax=Thalassobius vesicularis TaxID=1294297 RepID=A0A4S3MFJ8_9RHOB|nr:COQ9 family protein [Thalassobius vesicularis]THD76504.1 COQ9 family protein [Thalassobius vesicularis]